MLSTSLKKADKLRLGLSPIDGRGASRVAAEIWSLGEPVLHVQVSPTAGQLLLYKFGRIMYVKPQTLAPPTTSRLRGNVFPISDR
jgi:hypothetical protein